MYLDVQDLRNFYYRSTLGIAARQVLQAQIELLWPNVKGQTVAGYGFSLPYLRPFLKHARRTIALMPGPQGVMHWPEDQLNISVLCEEILWPLETGHVDRLIVVHGLESSERPRDLLEECSRVLGPGGKVLFVVPNRAGFWSRSERTPFGHGRPYSQSQLETLLRTHGFLPERHLTTLYQLPSDRQFWRKTANMWEKIGSNVNFLGAGGVLMVEATKRVQAPTGGVLAETVAKPLEALRAKAPAKPI